MKRLALYWTVRALGGLTARNKDFKNKYLRARDRRLNARVNRWLFATKNLTAR